MSDKPSILCFEKHYSDDSGVEFGVRYDREPYLHDKEIIGTVTMQAVDDITFPVTQLDWVIASLERIRAETQ